MGLLTLICEGKYLPSGPRCSWRTHLLPTMLCSSGWRVVPEKGRVIRLADSDVHTRAEL
jgi:hypothetical protein